jgi:hypothetical protein
MAYSVPRIEAPKEDISFLCYDAASDTVVDSRLLKRNPLLRNRVEEKEQAEVPAATLCDACPYCADVCEKMDCQSCRPVTSSSSSPQTSLRRSSNRSYTQCEIARHSTVASAWLVLGKGEGAKIVDASEWILNHPGGIRSILRHAGTTTDCSKDFKFHSSGV